MQDEAPETLEASMTELMRHGTNDRPTEIKLTEDFETRVDGSEAEAPAVLETLVSKTFEAKGMSGSCVEEVGETGATTEVRATGILDDAMKDPSGDEGPTTRAPGCWPA